MTGGRARRRAVLHLLLSTSLGALLAGCSRPSHPDGARGSPVGAKGLRGGDVATPGAAAHPSASLAGKVVAWVTAQPTRTWSNDWGPTLQMYGLVRAGQAFGLPGAVEYARRWLRERIAAGPVFVPPGERVDSNAYLRGPRLMVTGYCGSWGCNVVAPALDPQGQELGGITARIRSYIQEQAERTAEGGLKHGDGHETYWLDTLYYAVPGLAFEGRRTGNDGDVAEGARQLALHAAKLRDGPTGLFHHCWRERDNWVSPAFWGRGNGWVAMAAAEWLTLAPAAQSRRAEVLAILEGLARALVPLQTERGLWRTVLDRPGAYEEVSASSMFAFALARGVRLGLLGDGARLAAERCGPALARAVAGDGSVGGVSGGTDPGDAGHYLRVRTGTYPWGTGAWLLAAAELEALRSGAPLRIDRA